MRVVMFWWILMIVQAMLLASCATDSQSAHGKVVMVQFKPDPNRVELLAGMEGWLEVRNGCIYFVEKKGKYSALAVLPSTYKLLSSRGKVVGVEDAAANQTLEFGKRAAFGGGEDIIPDEKLVAPVPAACKGPMLSLYVAFDRKGF